MSLLNTRLTFSDGRSNKEYRVAIEPQGDGYVVNFAYGRIGSALKDGSKTSSPVDLAQAQKIAEKLLKEKIKKGYMPDESEGTDMPVKSERQDIVFRCQLSNPVTESKMASLVQQTRYIAQIKYDGERRPVFVENGQVTALNRTGEVVAINPAFVEPLVELANKYGGKLELDCEDMGTHLRIFDVLFVDGADLKGSPFSMRSIALDRLDVQTNSDILRFVESVEVSNKGVLDSLLGFARDSGQEGIILREASAIYEPDRPASLGTSLKIKFTNDLSAIVKQRNSSKRSVNLVLLDGQGGVVDMGNVTIPANVEMPVIGDVVDVKYLWALEGGKLIQPVFKRNRTGEIDPKQCTMSQVVIKDPQDVALPMAS